MQVKLVVVTKFAGMGGAILDRAAGIARMIPCCAVRRMEDVLVVTCNVAEASNAFDIANDLTARVRSITGVVLNIENKRRPVRLGVF